MSLSALRPSTSLLLIACSTPTATLPPTEADTDADADADSDSDADADSDSDSDADTDADADADSDSDADTDADTDTAIGCVDDGLEPNDLAVTASPWPSGSTTVGPYVLADEDWFSRPASFVIDDTFTVQYTGQGHPTVELRGDANTVLATTVGVAGEATVSATWTGSTVHLRIVPPAGGACLTYSVVGN